MSVILYTVATGGHTFHITPVCVTEHHCQCLVVESGADKNEGAWLGVHVCHVNATMSTVNDREIKCTVCLSAERT